MIYRLALLYLLLNLDRRSKFATGENAIRIIKFEKRPGRKYEEIVRTIFLIEINSNNFNFNGQLLLA